MIESFGVFMQHPWLIWVQRLLLLMAQVNLTLAVFNLLPIPPLDGYHLVNDRVFQITQVVLIALVLTGVLNKALSFCVSNLYEAVLKLFMLLTGRM